MDEFEEQIYFNTCGSELDQLRTENAALRAQLEASPAQEPLCWVIDDEGYEEIKPGYPGSFPVFRYPPDSAARIAELERQVEDLKAMKLMLMASNTDLTAKLRATEQERDKLILAVADHVTVRAEYYEKLRVARDALVDGEAFVRKLELIGARLGISDEDMKIGQASVFAKALATIGEIK